MATKKVFGQLICKCERCDGKPWPAKNNRMPKTCAHCRSELWDKKKPVNMKVLTAEKAKPTALQCAIVYRFDCGYFRDKDPATAVCKVCFKLAIWENKDLQRNLLEMVAEKGDPHLPEPEVELTNPDDIYKKMEEADELPMPKDFDLEDGLPPITGGEKEKKASKDNEKRQFEANARVCGKKEIDGEGKWQCNFFSRKSNNPPFPYCRLCWELVAVWGERAIGQ